MDENWEKNEPKMRKNRRKMGKTKKWKMRNRNPK